MTLPFKAPAPSLETQIAAVERASGRLGKPTERMTHGQIELERHYLKTVLDTLDFVRRNNKVIMTAVLKDGRA